MGRRLPDAIIRDADETDEDFVAREAISKRRLQIFKRLYQNYYLWQSLRESGDVGDVLVIEGIDYYLPDLMVGINTLPPQQMRAFDLICLKGYTESAATEKILPKSNWSTPVQQYSDDGLKKMVAAYDAKQVGTWDPSAAAHKRRRHKKKEDSAVAIAAVQEEKSSKTSPKSRRVDHLDWTVCSDDNMRLAEYINVSTGLGITGQQVKAVAFLRKPWYHSGEEQVVRKAIAAAKEAEKAKFAYETPEQRSARFEAARALKSAQAAEEKAKELQAKVRDLRIAAGLDPETGEPVAAA
jgi:hypothetical protein